jgi:flagellar basal-body rod protein FlgC
MDLFKAMEISSSGLHAQRVVIEVVSSNLANVQTTRTPEGGPYRRKHVVFTPSTLSPPFSDLLAGRMNQDQMGVKVDVTEEETLFKTIYDPSHPDSDETGFLQIPNINAMEEMVVLLSAVRSYEANVTAFNAAKNMILKSLEIGR